MSSILVNETEKLELNEFLLVSEFIQEHYGIQLPITKKKMVEARLQKRLKALNLVSFKDYFDYAFGDHGKDEYVHMIDLITTNKTEFFREPAHFDALSREIFSAILKGKAPNESLKIWSAACSTGEEIYSLLITLEEFFLRSLRRHNYQLVGTDVSMQVLKKAASAVYEESKIENVPLFIRKRYFLKSRDTVNPRARIKPELLKSVAFKHLNLLKPFNAMENSFDIIFCRNVLIYFNRTVQQDVISKLVERLRIGGYLFIGHSESLTNMQLPLVQVRPTLYKKIGA